MKKQKSVTRSILACIRLLAALIVLTAGFRSVCRYEENYLPGKVKLEPNTT